MTNTLHRYGDAESFRDDYIVFATPSSGRNDVDSVPKLKKFLELALPFKPVNIGDPVHGGSLRPERGLHTTSNWKRDMTPDFRAVIEGISEPASVVAIFDNQAAAEQFLKVAADADLGLSINMSASVEGAKQCCQFAGIARHSVGYSLGFEGATDKLRGPYNEGGLFGERAGWHDAAVRDAQWSPTSLPADGRAAGVTWYRTDVDLALPTDQDTSLGIEIKDPPGRHYRAILYVNGWQMGNYASDLGPQHSFPVPNGVLRPQGRNSITIAVWKTDESAGGLGEVALVNYGSYKSPPTAAR